MGSISPEDEEENEKGLLVLSPYDDEDATDLPALLLPPPALSPYSPDALTTKKPFPLWFLVITSLQGPEKLDTEMLKKERDGDGRKADRKVGHGDVGEVRHNNLP